MNPKEQGLHLCCARYHSRQYPPTLRGSVDKFIMKTMLRTCAELLLNSSMKMKTTLRSRAILFTDEFIDENDVADTCGADLLEFIDENHVAD